MNDKKRIFLHLDCESKATVPFIIENIIELIQYDDHTLVKFKNMHTLNKACLKVCESVSDILKMIHQENPNINCPCSCICEDENEEVEGEFIVKEGTHIVLKEIDLTNYLSEEEQKIFDILYEKVIDGRKGMGKKENSYYVVNLDEPYAEEVFKVIKKHESNKKIKGEKK